MKEKKNQDVLEKLKKEKEKQDKAKGKEELDGDHMIDEGGHITYPYDEEDNR